MPYTANKYNYATPLSGAAGLIGDSYTIMADKPFMLHDNVLDGTYHPIVGDVGIWGASVSDEDGMLPEAFVVTITENLVVNAYRLAGDPRCYPTAFTVQFYNGSTLLHTISEAANTDPVYVAYLPQTLNVTSYVLTITKVSAPNSVARVYNTYNLYHVKRSDNATLVVTDAGVSSELISRKRSDNLSVAVHEPRSTVVNIINKTFDTLSVSSNDVATLTNIHTVMKSPFRRVYGKVYITYTDPMLSSETLVHADGSAYNSQPAQVLDGDANAAGRYFTLYNNDLTGDYVLSDVRSHVGWVSDAVSDSEGNFDEPQVLQVSFSSRPINNLVIYFDDSHGSVPKDFSVDFVHENGQVTTKHVSNNYSREASLVSDVIADVTAIVIKITSTTLPGNPAGIVEIPISSTFLYKGYKEESNLVSIDLLEELTYDDEIEALGGVSANVTTVTLDNSTRDFFFNNTSSPIARQLKRNRKIVPYLGAEIFPGYIEWYPLGTFWSYNWKVPVNGLIATVTGFDTLGLLDTTDFTNHQVLVDNSVGAGLEYVLNDAKRSLDFLEFDIADELYDVRIPYIWFEQGSHTAAIRKLSECYPMHVYCDRNGVIKAMPQKLKLDYFYDSWSDSTNVFSKTYDSLYTTLPNVINVTVVHPVLIVNDQLVTDDTSFDVSVVNSRVLNFGKPCASDFVLTIDCDTTVEYEYTAYSWGVEINFAGTGKVRSIICTGTSVDASATTTLTSRDADSIRYNGAVTRNVSSDFIQTDEQAAMIIDRLRGLSELDKYDATVEYRGDISLTINDPIRLLNGIAPDDRYNIKRHQLFWNGALSGSADLNT